MCGDGCEREEGVCMCGDGCDRKECACVVMGVTGKSVHV